ncbi:NUDIX domain-containing protein [Paenibacillus sp. URB8-2]|uniref:NUDIX domain-containing protein n=1 Tax=Paenibacillus sp. URB8-2 TaxID=2741301 RepID=UPI0015C1706D|nr:NUDIX domain-containing protein [Paenibacillus sp. URB8-2]BCG59450.1 ADP-ribose pyrophosphatase [Paenibacillus sp. URB8-2]
MKPIRNSAKAIIIDNNKILLTRNQDEKGFFYLFPGGGQEKGEELKRAVSRECIEELGCEVEVGDIVYIREYIGKNHEFSEWDYDVHQVEFYFECTINNKFETFNGTNPDKDQVGVEWIEVDKLSKIRVYPLKLVEQIQNKQIKPIYLGDAN